MTLLVSWSVQVLDSWAEPSYYFPVVPQKYFKQEEGNHLKAFLESPVFFSTSVIPQAMTLAFLHVLSNVNGHTKNTCDDFFSLAAPTTNPIHVTLSVIYFYQK